MYRTYIWLQLIKDFTLKLKLLNLKYLKQFFITKIEFLCI